MTIDKIGYSTITEHTKQIPKTYSSLKKSKECREIRRVFRK
jgi:hypothetical protein